MIRVSIRSFVSAVVEASQMEQNRRCGVESTAMLKIVPGAELLDS